MNPRELTPCYFKVKIYITFLWNCGWITDMKNKGKKFIVKFENALVRTDDE